MSSAPWLFVLHFGHCLWTSPLARARELVARLSLMLSPVLLELATPNAKAEIGTALKESLGAILKVSGARTCGFLMCFARARSH